MNKKQLLDDICSDESCQDCLLKQLLLKDSKYNSRLLVQTKLIEKAKFEESERQKQDIGWQRAWEIWVEKGYAKKFAEVWDENKSFKQIYKETTT
jgi:DNA-binding transcriptional regulator/RsmH inhibitor MraZ